jgi:NhaP-type Na+/H+ or K+/H+ antiporter
MEYNLVLVVIGIAALGMAWMPAVGAKLRLSYALIYLVIGVVFYLLFPSLPKANPLVHENFTVRLTELVVLVALMGSGLKIDERFSFKRWAIPLRLVSLGMLCCMALTAFAAWYWLKMDVASSILLAAVLAPTDPVLASDVQVGPPNEDERDHARFALTAEGGMNDGTAFPFVWLGIMLAGGATTSTAFWIEWVGFTLFYKLAAGVVCGFLVGRGVAYLLFNLPEKSHTLRIQDGFVALSVTLLVYGIAELAKGYGFIAVFTCAITLRNYEMGHKLHTTLHKFSDQIERILVAVTLLIFGGALVSGILESLTLELALLGMAFLFIIRPLTTFFFLGKKFKHLSEKLMVSFFGIRGIGSLYYISFALQKTDFENAKQLWSLVSFVVLMSIIIHGVSANIALRKVQDVRRKNA